MNKTVLSILMLILLGVGIYFVLKNTPEETVAPVEETPSVEYVSYKNSEYGPEFTYPENWGEVSIIPGNKTCPDDDTYRTADTLIIHDWEFSFAEFKLPGSESMIRTGVRTYELEENNLNDCGDEFFLSIASGRMMPEALSSVRLMSYENPNGLKGTYNEEASRLNTESRRQYTFFVPKIGGYHVIQPYMSFVPYFGSPELAELDGKFGGDMMRYIAEGETAEDIRAYFLEFEKMSQSLKFSAE